MKKLLIILVFVVIYFLSNSNDIPSDAIRLRIIANSNSDYDQNIKLKVKNEVQKDLLNIINNNDNSKEVETKIIKNINLIDNNIETLLKQENYNLGYNINYGYNYFPSKELNGKKIKEGNYKSLVVSLGEGKGDNWWCILFPPLCLIEAEESEESVEYDFFIKKLFNIFS